MQGWHLSGLVSSIRAASWPQPDDWDHCPPPVPARVEDSPPGGSVRGTRPGDARTIQATPSEQNDPRAPKPRLLRQARHGTIGYLGGVDKFFDPVENKEAHVGGEGGIRTHVPLRDKTLSRRPRYDHFGTSPISMRGAAARRGGYRHGPVPRRDVNTLLSHGRAGPSRPQGAIDDIFRRTRKNCWMSSRHASSSTPPGTRNRWFGPRVSSARIVDTRAPVLGSTAPYTTSRTRASTSAPTHIRHGSSVTYSVASVRR